MRACRPETPSSKNSVFQTDRPLPVTRLVAESPSRADPGAPPPTETSISGGRRRFGATSLSIICLTSRRCICRLLPCRASMAARRDVSAIRCRSAGGRGRGHQRRRRSRKGWSRREMGPRQAEAEDGTTSARGDHRVGAGHRWRRGTTPASKYGPGQLDGQFRALGGVTGAGVGAEERPAAPGPARRQRIISAMAAHNLLDVLGHPRRPGARSPDTSNSSTSKPDAAAAGRARTAVGGGPVRGIARNPRPRPPPPLIRHPDVVREACSRMSRNLTGFEAPGGSMQCPCRHPGQDKRALGSSRRRKELGPPCAGRGGRCSREGAHELFFCVEWCRTFTPLWRNHDSPEHLPRRWGLCLVGYAALRSLLRAKPRTISTLRRARTTTWATTRTSTSPTCSGRPAPAVNAKLVTALAFSVRNSPVAARMSCDREPTQSTSSRARRANDPKRDEATPRDRRSARIRSATASATFQEVQTCTPNAAEETPTTVAGLSAR